MATRQYILPGALTPVYVNETTNQQSIQPGVYLNETATAPPPKPPDILFGAQPLIMM